MNLASVLVFSVVVVGLILAVRSLYKSHKAALEGKAGCSCGGGCAGCSGGCGCAGPFLTSSGAQGKTSARKT